MGFITESSNPLAPPDSSKRSNLPIWMDDNEDLKKTISQLTDEQLVTMLTTDAGEYRKVALEFAEAERKTRGIPIPEPPEETLTRPTDQESAMETSSRLPMKVGTGLIVVGLVVCIVPYFISIGVPFYLAGAIIVLKSNQTMKNKVMVLGVSLAILVGLVRYLLSLGPW